MKNNNILFDKNNFIATLTFNRPSHLNALNKETLIKLREIVKEIEKDDEVKVLVVTGEGKAFVAGADISEMKGMNPQESREFSYLGNEVFRRIELLEKPVIAAINGFALGGGCELAMTCDIRIASENATFGQPEVSLGITPGFGGTQRMPRLIGTSKAKELIFTGKIIKSQEAERIGLVNMVVPHNELILKSIEMANYIIKNSSVAVGYSKSAINRGLETDIETGIMTEQNIFGLCFANLDQKEGMEAFLEKRSPKFK
ncbi:enoyl-CoA hydratase [Dethiosulfatibacter aminovorans DSM 17477]|uniref:Enoyl-CoA hydratase n=1 Tax=Dethiosulfatibacter aminovorans DSM 17477 TaxID=1121476 RepID=A0A1M6MZB3_9FIRM|nr:enoyl-CoA hydratase-related protein [Dethiosulfatibacter aminovorans]SHJ88744.1 enoyl-CoA hydratase [Dethiosulfatibacter aminovorans DSM 17477]